VDAAADEVSEMKGSPDWYLVSTRLNGSNSFLNTWSRLARSVCSCSLCSIRRSCRCRAVSMR